MRTSWTRLGATLLGFCLLGALSDGQSLLWDRGGPPALQGQLGAALWTISDVDADGVKDLLVGAPFSASYVGILSGATGNTIVEFFAPASEMLRPIGTVGDTTGDGMIDFLVVHLPPGQTYPFTELVSGSDGSVFSTPNYVYGTSPVPLGDINGDGFGDFAMPGPGSQGWVDVFHGPGFNYSYSIGPQWAYSTFGRSIASCGDLNGDGIPDFIVGAPGQVGDYQLPEVVPGFAYVFSGADGSMLRNWTGPFVGSRFGAAVLSPGDVNGDGIPDFVVSAPGGGTFGFNFSLSLFSGSDSSQIGSFTAPNPTVNWYGTRLCALGDVDGDGIGDYATRGLFGMVDVFSGATTAPIYHITTNLPLTPGWAGYNVGLTLAALEDFDGDQFPEILIGSPAITGTPSLLGHIQCYTLRPQGVTVAGSGCAQSNGALARIGATGVPHSNSTFSVNLSNVPSGLGAGLIVGLSNTQFGSVSLPWQVDPILAPGCSLLASIDWFLTTTTTALAPGGGSGRAIMPLSIPAGLTGLTFYTQWGITNPPGSPALGSLTRSLTVTVQ